jgi:Zn finger protein HypA/HybF involved in hydrogenase expression
MDVKWDCRPGAINLLPAGCSVSWWEDANRLVRCSYCGGHVTPTEMSGNCPNCAGRLA